MTTPSKPEDLLEMAEKQAGAEAMQILAGKHLNALMELREQIAIKDIDLLSENIASNKRVDHAVKIQITSLHKKMGFLIEEVAKQIENKKYKTSEEAIEGFRLSRAQKNSATALISADKTIHISCQSLKVAVDLCCTLNREILKRLDSATDMDPAEETKLVLGNALLVYELTDFVIRFIEDFHLRGMDEIESIHKDMQKTISNLRDGAKSLRKQANAPNIEESVRQQVLRDVADRDESIMVLEQEWSSYMQTIKSYGSETAYVRKRIPNLHLIRNNAKEQINLLEAVAVLKIVQNNAGVIEATILQLEKIQLASLSADRVKRLLRIKA